MKSPAASPFATPTTSPPVPDEVPSGDEFVRDYDRILEICATGPVVSYSLKRLKVLEYAFNFHKLLNSRREVNAAKYTPMDSSTIVRVDTHVHLAAGMTEKHLLEFIKTKLRSASNETVMVKDGKEMTLRQVFDSLGLDESQLSVNSLDVRAGSKTFHRFDQFNALYNPFGVSDLRTIFLKASNMLKGRYLAELTKELFDRAEQTPKKTEYRLSVYGKSKREWGELAKWVKMFEVHSTSNRWLIQVPRIYSALRQ
jgi:AMP deaminase